MDCIERVMIPAFDGFKPQFLLVSTGFDAYRDDDMSDMTLSTKWFSWIMRKIMIIADKHWEDLSSPCSKEATSSPAFRTSLPIM